MQNHLNANPTTPQPIPATAYYRVSTGQQDDSIEQQRPQVEALAQANNYVITREYVDEGLSGLTSNRTDFQRMLREVHGRVGGEVKCILMYDTARLSREDIVDAATWKQGLKNQGVFVHSVKQGKVDWSTFEGRLIDAINQEMAHLYSVHLSRDSIRGRVGLFEAGEWPNSKVPYGYDRLYISPDGVEYPVARLGIFKMGRGWRRVVVTNEAESKVVKDIFDLYLGRDWSLGAISREMQGRGVIRPDGNAVAGWTKDTVRGILKKKAYAGFVHIGGAVNKLRWKTALNRVGPMERPGNIPALITLAQWEAAQEKLKREGHRGKGTRQGAAILSGVLICGHCKHPMCKYRRTDSKGNTYTYFKCLSGKKYAAGTCAQWSVRESEILPIAIETLVREIDGKVLKSLEPSPTDSQDESGVALESLRAQLAEIDAAIERGGKRLLTIDDALLPALEKSLLEYRERRIGIQERMRALVLTKGDLTEFAEWWSKVKDKLTEVIPGRTVHASDGGDQWDNPEAEGVELEVDRLRGLLKSLGLRITLYFTKKSPKGREWAVDHARLSATVEHSDRASGTWPTRPT